MLVLAIETSTPRSSVALVGPEGAVASASLGVPRRHGEFLAPAVRFCLDQAGRSVADVTGVTVGLGPGLYTGLRVGIAFARAFAAARSLPMVGMSGLDVLAFQARHTRSMVCATIDARRGELFWALYRTVPGGVQREGELQVSAPDVLVAELDGLGEDCHVVGEGLTRLPDVSSLHHVSVGSVERGCPDAIDLGSLAVPRFQREDTVLPGALAAIYLRSADAKIGWQERGRLRGGDG